MTERKFTPPEDTEFPAEYVDGNGNESVILGRGPNKVFPFIGYDHGGRAACWTEEGLFVYNQKNEADLHDIPKRITTWHNVYKTWLGTQCSTRSNADEIHNSIRGYVTEQRLCVYRIERDEDGSNSELFEEEV